MLQSKRTVRHEGKDILQPRVVGLLARFSVAKAAVTRLLGSPGSEVWVVDWLILHPGHTPASPGRLEAPSRRPSIMGSIAVDF